MTRRSAVFVASILVTAVVLASAVRTVDLPAAMASLRTANPWIILGVAAVSLLTHVYRVVRWRVLLGPMVRARFVTLFFGIVSGLWVSNTLPGRFGEFVRPYLLSRREAVSSSTAFATVVLERVLDALVVMSFLGLYIALGVSETGERSTIARGLAVSGYAIVAVVLGAFIGLAVASRWLAGLVQVIVAGRWMPERLRPHAVRIAGEFQEGLAAIRSARALAHATGATCVLWLVLGLELWLTARAFGLTSVPYSSVFVLMPLLMLGTAVPSPGGIAIYAAYAFGLTTFFGVDESTAAAATLALYVATQAPVFLIGPVALAHFGVSRRNLAELAVARGVAAAP